MCVKWLKWQKLLEFQPFFAMRLAYHARLSPDKSYYEVVRCRRYTGFIFLLEWGSKFNANLEKLKVLFFTHLFPQWFMSEKLYYGLHMLNLYKNVQEKDWYKICRLYFRIFMKYRSTDVPRYMYRYRYRLRHIAKYRVPVSS